MLRDSWKIGLCVVALACAVCSPLTARREDGQDRRKFPSIIGGTPAQEGDYPWMVGILDTAVLEESNAFNAQICGGTLISPDWVLTAGHCVTASELSNVPLPPEDSKVLIGSVDLLSQNAQIVDVTRVVLHPDYDGSDPFLAITADIALLRLAQPYQGPVLPVHRGNPVGGGVDSTILGWGATLPDSPFDFPEILQEAAIQTTTDEFCESANPKGIGLDETHLCAATANVDTCIGDSGGPLVVPGSEVGSSSTAVQVGITSFAFAACADPEVPGVYTRVSRYTDWIDSVLGNRSHFSTFGNGQTLQTDIVIYNPSPTESAEGDLLFKDQTGTVLDSAAVLAPGHSADFVLPPLGSTTISTSGGSGPLLEGSVWMESDIEVSGVIRFTLPGIGIAGVSVSRPGQSMIAPVRRVSTVNTGLAILNTEDVPVTVDLQLKDEAGQVVANGTAQLQLDGMARDSSFLDELFPNANTVGFKGTVCIESTGGKVAAVAIELGTGGGEFTTLSVTVVE